MKNRAPFIPHVPFDFVAAEPAFPAVKAQGEAQSETNPIDEALTTALTSMDEPLTPTDQDAAAITDLQNKVQAVLDGLLTATDETDDVQLDEIRPVGPFKKGTHLRGERLTGFTIVLKTLPTKEAVEALAGKVHAGLQAANPGEAVSVSTTDRGFDLAAQKTGVVANCLIATLPPNMRKIDATIHLEYRTLQQNAAEVRRAMWFEENGQHETVKTLVRVLLELKRRHEGLAPMSRWMVELLGHFSVMYNPSHQALPLAQAFKRVFQLLSAGLFLPGSAGIPDPCEGGNLRVHTTMSLEEQDLVCLTSQNLLRVLNQPNGYRHILGLEGNGKCLTSPTTWGNGVRIVPLERAYEKPEFREENNENGNGQQATTA